MLSANHAGVMPAGQIQHGDLFDEESSDMADAVDNNRDSDDACLLSSNVTRSGRSSARCRCSGEVCRYVVTMALLTTVNLINYMDRFSVAGDFSRLFHYLLLCSCLSAGRL